MADGGVSRVGAFVVYDDDPAVPTLAGWSGAASVVHVGVTNRTPRRSLLEETSARRQLSPMGHRHIAVTHPLRNLGLCSSTRAWLWSTFRTRSRHWT